jgi:hypothetical protein
MEFLSSSACITEILPSLDCSRPGIADHNLCSGVYSDSRLSYADRLWSAYETSGNIFRMLSWVLNASTHPYAGLPLSGRRISSCTSHRTP